MPTKNAMPQHQEPGVLRRLAHDRTGNTYLIVAGALLPLLAMVGGGVDMGRAYMVQSRLQQACDAGVLAARKRLGTESIASGEIPSETSKIGERMFQANFRDAAYGTTAREFEMTLESDFSISGVAQARMPLTLMGLFGHKHFDVATKCTAQLNFRNTDVMMVLDTTGSMAMSNPGDSDSRIQVLRDVIVSFNEQLTASAQAGTRIRLGFLPYSTNVNVGHLLKDEWVTNEWGYSSRRLLNLGRTTSRSSVSASSPVSGLMHDTLAQTYPALGSAGSYYCNPAPASTVSSSVELVAETSEEVTGPPAGTKTVQTYERTRNGASYQVSLDGSTCNVIKTNFDNFVDTYDYITQPTYSNDAVWLYDWLYKDTSNWRAETEGCIEERQTYEIDDYDNVDLSRALDLNLDMVPTEDPASARVSVTENLSAESQTNIFREEVLPNSAATKWRPMYPNLIYGRALKWDGSGGFQKRQSITFDDYMSPATLYTTACPPAARKLSTITPDELKNYLNTLVPNGSTYHDTGMIWGGRMISPTGLFAAENADVSTSSPTNRNLIFLTDGETAPLDVSYSAYGFEPVDQRRWSLSSPYSLAETIEKRFSFACNEVKKRGVTVWVIGFGIDLNSTMKGCAGEGKYFEAADAAELNSAFGQIAKSTTDLRITN
ncbi:Tad domain-containing protein [Novosphingobium sp.]|uniref:TadE/TadG family type IV pilus assembly protein n=1 Tax=Novosphingobium sp. TaxID=1874826 RepID=UPI0034356135